MPKAISRRLGKPAGNNIDRDKVITFSFEGQSYAAFQGDTIASALLANNISLISRSFKYHRPRGPMSMAGLEADSLVQLKFKPNSAADLTLIEQDMEIYAQNYVGSLNHDRGAIMELFSRFLPVGFYYKAFFRPRGIWEKIWEPLVRRHTGLGRVDLRTPHLYHDKCYGFCDVAVIGGGPAGMQSALSAAAAGAEVKLIEEEFNLGGSLNYARFEIDEPEKARQLRIQLIDEVTTHENITVMSGATCNGYFADGWLAVIQKTRLHKIRARQVIVASGSMEQPAIFRNNDLPGVMMASAVQRLIRKFGVKPGERAVVLTGNDEGYLAALDMHEQNIEVVAIVDMRPCVSNPKLLHRVEHLGIKTYQQHTVFEAYGKNHISSVAVHEIFDRGQVKRNATLTVDCDLLSMSVGYAPTYQIPLQSGGKISYNDETALFSITDLPKSVRLAGSVNGVYELNQVLVDAQLAAGAATDALGLPSSIDATLPPPAVSREINFPWPIFAHPKGKEFVDLDEDLQIQDIINACADGYAELELVKRYSTVGMGPSQGRHSALATARIVANINNKTIAEIGITTSRPPVRGEKLGHIAGRGFEPERRTAMHDRHLEAGAELLTAGLWWRPAYYGSTAERDSSIEREVLTIRNKVGIIDVSTLGGLEVRGKDAAEFLDRLYTFSYAKLAVGRSRYLLMTSLAGTVVDDGVACRMSADHFYVTATTTGVDSVYRNMLWWNAQWRLDVDITNVTAAYSAVNIAGPDSRRVLENAGIDIAISSEDFPYLGVRRAQVAGVPARLLRVGFVGELSYEIHAPSSQGEYLWDALVAAGKPYGIRPVGIEAQRVLRLEKGHIIIGQDTDAMSTPQELHMDWAIAKKKAFFVGARSLELIAKQKPKRQLVGFKVDQKTTLEESNIVLNGDNKIIGHVTSVAYSASLKSTIGLAYTDPNAQVGQTMLIKNSRAQICEVTIAPLPFYDADGRRQEM